jgi:pre-mRNA-processing factor 8
MAKRVCLSSGVCLILALEWGKGNRDADVVSAIPPGYAPSHYEKVQVLLSDQFLGFYLTPNSGSWNYYFMGHKLYAGMKYGLRLSNPKESFHEAHRQNHFLQFVAASWADIPVDSDSRFN